MSCCFTGHRELEKGQEQALLLALEHAIREEYFIGTRDFYCGGAKGFDLLSAEAVLRLKKSHDDIKLHMILPSRDQATSWTTDEILRYKHVLEGATDIVYTSTFYYQGIMRDRNMALVKHTDACIAYVTRQKSGSGQTLRFAKKAGHRIYALAEIVEKEA